LIHHSGQKKREGKTDQMPHDCDWVSLEIQVGERVNDTGGWYGVLAGDTFPGSNEKGEMLA
jgi:hypothetical protein